MSLEVRLAHRVHPGLDLDLQFRVGDESVVLFGPSGSGKSTTLRLIAGLARPESGTIRLGGDTLFDRSSRVDLPLRGRRIGLIFQDDLLFPHLTVDRNVRYGLHRLASREADARLAEVAALCGIESLLGRSPSTLSGGERQRVGLARALAPRPRLLLADEPVSALDLEARYSLIDRLVAIRRAESIPVLYVTHSPDEAIALGSRVLRLSGGRIVDDGAPLDVLTSARSRSGPIRNVFAAVVESHDPDGLSTTLRVVDGPRLIVPKCRSGVGSTVRVGVGADDLVLALGPIGETSARNRVDGRVERISRDDGSAEVVVRTGGVAWVVGVTPASVGSLGLIEGSEVRMIVKARSCQVFGEGSLS